MKSRKPMCVTGQTCLPENGGYTAEYLGRNEVKFMGILAELCKEQTILAKEGKVQGAGDNEPDQPPTP